LESSLKTARLRRAVFRLQSREFAPEGRELSALKLILRIAEAKGLTAAKLDVVAAEVDAILEGGETAKTKTS